VTTQPAEQAGADRAISDPTALIPTPTPTTSHVTAREISEFLRHLVELRVDDPTERDAFLARKAALFARIADPHPHRGTGPTPAAPERRTP